MALDYDNSGRRMLISIYHKLWLWHDEDILRILLESDGLWCHLPYLPLFFELIWKSSVFCEYEIINCFVSRKQTVIPLYAIFFISTHYVIAQMRAQNNTKTAGGKLYSALGTFKPESLFSVMCIA